MYRGTTPTFTFKLPMDGTTLTKLAVTFRQDGMDAIERELADCVVTADSVTCTLTEAETLRLQAGRTLEIQLRAGVGTARMASQIFRIPVARILKEGML